MKAITILEPYASLIANGQKWTENRTWPTSHRGPIAIHAGKGTRFITAKQLREEYPHAGCVLATALLVTCIHLETGPTEEQLQELAAAGLKWEQVRTHEHAHGPYVFVLTEIRKVSTPIPINGKERLWTISPDILHASVEEMAF